MSSVRPKLKPETPKHLTAWDSATGISLYWTGTGWSVFVDEAVILIGETADAALENARADEVIVTEPYLMEAAPGGGVTGREKLRESIRAEGPTTHPEFSREVS